MPLFIGNSGVEKVFIGGTEVQQIRTEGDLRFNAFTNTPPQVSLSADAASYNQNATATFTATVVDPDVPSLQTLTYVWTVGGIIVKTTTGSSSLVDTYTHSSSGGTSTIGVTVTDSGSGVSNSVSISRTWLSAALSFTLVGTWTPAGNFSNGPQTSFAHSSGTPVWFYLLPNTNYTSVMSDASYGAVSLTNFIDDGIVSSQSYSRRYKVTVSGQGQGSSGTARVRISVSGRTPSLVTIGAGSFSFG
jgi:hypothetical protein